MWASRPRYRRVRRCRHRRLSGGWVSVACPCQQYQNSQIQFTGNVDVYAWVSVACPSHQSLFLSLTTFRLPVLCERWPIPFFGFGTGWNTDGLEWESVAFSQHHFEMAFSCHTQFTGNVDAFAVGICNMPIASIPFRIFAPFRAYDHYFPFSGLANLPF